MIINKVNGFADEYYTSIVGSGKLPPKFKFTTLKYFHDELGITEEISKRDKIKRLQRLKQRNQDSDR